MRHAHVIVGERDDRRPRFADPPIARMRKPLLPLEDLSDVAAGAIGRVPDDGRRTVGRVVVDDDDFVVD